MSLKVTTEPDGWGGLGWPLERCCLCRIHTRHWYAPNNVALCLSCAKVAKKQDIPSKMQWIAKEGFLRGNQ